MNTTDTSKGKRYTDAERRKILNHVDQINKTRGRGGIASASREFGVSALTISNWLNSDEPIALMVRTSGRPASRNQRVLTLRKLTTLHDEISRRQEELAALQKQFDDLKKTL